MKLFLVAAMVFALTAQIYWQRSHNSTWLINLSTSVPRGLYRTIDQQPETGQLAIVKPYGPIARLAYDRGYLARGHMLLKPIAARSGDEICRQGRDIFINGAIAVKAWVKDSLGRILISWVGCIRLRRSQVFLLAYHAASFDSRYFGAIERRHILGTAIPLWLIE